MSSQSVHFDISQLCRYRKKDLLRYVIASTDIASQGAAISLSTLEGEVVITAGEDTLVMVGPCQDVYPVTRELFSRQYKTVPESVDAVKNLACQYGWELKKLSPCRLKTASYIYATAVDRDFSVSLRERNAILYGKAGDYYAVSAHLPDNPYIIQADVMAQTYQPDPDT